MANNSPNSGFRTHIGKVKLTGATKQWSQISQIPSATTTNDDWQPVTYDATAYTGPTYNSKVVKVVSRRVAPATTNVSFVSFEGSFVQPLSLYENSFLSSSPSSGRIRHGKKASHGFYDWTVSQPQGKSNVASFDGTVDFAGNLSGYGPTVILRHEKDGITLFTKYAHNNALLVKKGDRVSKNQVIAKLGNKGETKGKGKYNCHWGIFTDYAIARGVLRIPHDARLSYATVKKLMVPGTKLRR